MKTNKKLYPIIILFLLFMVIISSCNKKVPSKINPSEQLSDLDKKYIIEKEESVSIEKIIQTFEDKIQNYITDNDSIELNILDIYQDKLLMSEGKNKKQFNNIFLKLELDLAGYENMSMTELEETSHKINKEIFNLFSREDEGYFKLNSINVDFVYTLNKSIYSYVNSYSMVGDILESLNIKQSEEELVTQKIIYDYVNQNDEMILRRFGILDDLDILFVEIPIYTQNNDIINSLKRTSNALNNEILSNEQSQKYVSDNEIKKIIISFYTPWYKDKKIEYEYTISN